MHSARDLFAAVLGLLVAAPLVWAAAVAVRVYRFESRFYRPQRSRPCRPTDIPVLHGLHDVHFAAAGGERIAGWYQAPREPGGPAVVLASGVPGDRAQLVAAAALLARHGYGVLLFDWPGYGESEGRMTYGLAERRASSAALDWLTARPEVGPGRVGGLGYSLGAYLLVITAAADPRLRAVVAEGVPTNLNELVDWRYRHSAPVGPWAARLAARHAGVDLGVTDALRDVRRIAPRALLLIGGDHDQAVPAEMAARLHAAAGEPKALWLAGGGHCAALEQAPEEYERRVIGWFERALAAPGGTP